MYLQGVEHAYDVVVTPGTTLGDLRRDFEVQHCRYNFEVADADLQRTLFDRFEAECRRLLDADLVHPAYEFVLKCSHAFNLLDARGVLSHTERQGYVQRVRRLAEGSARGYLALHGHLGDEAAVGAAPIAPAVDRERAAR
jgi:glycyl-tRNA synthetase alpha chain